MGVFGWIAVVIWELRLKEPIIEFRLLASRNFAIAYMLFCSSASACSAAPC